jgi:hypothetical protein
MRRIVSIGVAMSAAVFGSVVPAASSATAAPGGYEPLPAPQRLVDTRSDHPTVDGEFSGIGKRGANTVLAVDVAGRAGLGPAVGTVVLNLTVDQPEAPGFLTLWPCGLPRPTASNLNYVAGQTVAVAALAKVADDGTICVYTLAAAHVVIDVAGEFPAGSFAALAVPERMVDTRAGGPTIDGQASGQGLRSARSTYRVRVAGRGSLPAGVTAVALNVTATAVGGPGFLTVFACDEEQPNASNVNYSVGYTTSNAVLTRLDPGGDVCIFTLAPVHLVIDVAGSLPASVFDPLPEPRRLLDSRNGGVTFDGQFRAAGLQPDGASLQLRVAGRAGIPAGATAVVLNVTTTESTEPGFVTAHPQGSARPGASNVNFTPGATVANLVIAALGPTGDVCLFNRGGTHLVVDVAGWLTGPASVADPASCPARTANQPIETIRTNSLRRPALHRVVGTDLIGVYICKIPADSTVFDGSRQHTATAEDFAALADAEVAPYFDVVSGGRYRVDFVPLGTIAANRDDGPEDCIDKALARTGDPYTNVLIADSTTRSIGVAGFASPGLIMLSESGQDPSVFDRSPAASHRGGWIAGTEISTLPNPGTIIHELGHTVHWPHSYIGPWDEYDNPVDVMSSGFGSCTNDPYIYRCDPGNTIAFNRFASGWLKNGQVVVHPSGTANYLLDAPNNAGVQAVLLPDPAQPLTMLTIEARPAIGNDDFFEAEGVALHIIDQVNRTGGLSGLSTSRVSRQAIGSPDSYDHVVRIGQTITAHGVAITVLRRIGNRYEVRVAGTFKTPGSAFFTESVESSGPSCATSDMEVAIAAGCYM